MALGVYVSRCSGRVDRVIDVDSALEGVRRRAAVIRVFDDIFDPAVAERIVQDIADAELDAVVLAGNSVDYYAKSLSGGHLKDRIVSAGVNPNKVVTANLLEQVALAHPDDPEFFCGSTFAKWAAEGAQITFVFATSGDKGSDVPDMTPEKLVAIREEEERHRERGVDEDDPAVDPRPHARVL